MSRATEKEKLLLTSLTDLDNVILIAVVFSIFGVIFVILGGFMCIECDFIQDLQVYSGIALFVAGCAFIIIAPFVRTSLTTAIVMRNKHAWKIQRKLEKLQPLIEEEKLAVQRQYEALKQSQMQAQKSQTKEPNTTLKTQSSNRPQPQISEGKTSDPTLAFLAIGFGVIMLLGIVLACILAGMV